VTGTMTALVWVGLGGFTALLMIIEHRLPKSDEPKTSVHYGHSDVADHEYEALLRTSGPTLDAEHGEAGGSTA